MVFVHKKLENIFWMKCSIFFQSHFVPLNFCLITSSSKAIFYTMKK